MVSENFEASLIASRTKKKFELLQIARGKMSKIEMASFILAIVLLLVFISMGREHFTTEFLYPFILVINLIGLETYRIRKQISALIELIGEENLLKAAIEKEKI